MSRCHSCLAEQRVGHRCLDEPCSRCGEPRWQYTAEQLGTNAWLVVTEPCEVCSPQLQEARKP